MKNILFVIFLKKFLRKTCWPPAPEHGDHLDPRITCHILCPASETHRGGSTDAQGARREGNKGMESTRIPGEDQLHLSGAVQNKMLWEDMVSCWQNRKKIQIFPTNMYACMYTHVYTWFHSIWNVLKAEVEDMDAPWMEGWTLLWAGRKLGHAEDGKPVTGEMTIVLLYVSYTWEWEKYRKY